MSDIVADTADKLSDKPEYRVPTMAEIRAVPWNGLTAASTFSGAGGSSLGYAMAGFWVAWANEFVPAARETYEANKIRPCTIDARDIRDVQADHILNSLGIGVGALDLLDGSPPCASFSTAGKRHVGWGEVKPYSDTKQRTDDLFGEFVRLVDGLKPRVFVAENVSGLVKGTAKGMFLEILAALRACGYRVEAKVLDAQWLGVPQARQRLFFQGVREDLNAAPAWPKPLSYRYSVRDALPWIRQVTGGNKAAFDNKGKAFGANKPCRSIKGGDTLGLSPFQFVVESETDISRFAIGREWEKLSPGASVWYGGRLHRPSPRLPSPTIGIASGSSSSAGVVHPTEKRRFSIAELKRLCAFPDDFTLTGTYAQQWERLGRAVPPVMMAALAGAVLAGPLAGGARE